MSQSRTGGRGLWLQLATGATTVAWRRTASDPRRSPATSGTGWTGSPTSSTTSYSVECLEAAVWCCLDADDLESAVVRTVNLAGEADTMGAVAGGAAGAHWGVAAIPNRWLAKLHQRQRITDCAGKILDCCG